MTTTWPLPPVLDIREVGDLTEPLSTGAGQSMSIAPLASHPAFLLKTYRTPGGTAQAARLDRLVQLAEKDTDDARVLRQRTSWPVARVRDAGQDCVACVIPRAPERFRVSARPAGQVGTVAPARYLEIDLLAQPAESLARRGLPVPAGPQRLTVARRVVDVAASLERLRLVYSDWSYSNAFWTGHDWSVFLIDVDGCAEGSGVNICQPNWEDPLTPRHRPADTYVERYRVGLLVSRILTGERDIWQAARSLQSPDGRACSGAVAEVLLDMLLVTDRLHRPSVTTLATVLADGPYVFFPGRRHPIPPAPRLAPPVAVPVPAGPADSARPGTGRRAPTVGAGSSGRTTTGGTPTSGGTPAGSRNRVAVAVPLVLLLILVVTLIAVAVHG